MCQLLEPFLRLSYLSRCKLGTMTILILQHYPEPLLVSVETRQSDSRSLSGINKLSATNHWSVGKRLTEE